MKPTAIEGALRALDVLSIPPSQRMHYKRVQCADGASVSIQASSYSYCRPRDNAGPYTLIEAGFPSVNPPDSWMEFCESPEKPTETVYGYMPVDRVHEFIDAHGGMVGGELPPGCER